MKIEIDILANKDCDQVFLDVSVDENLLTTITAKSTCQTISATIPDSMIGQHSVTLVMRGKSREHTVLDKQGNIVDDVSFMIEKLEFEELDMREIFCMGHKCYLHNFNTDQPHALDEFYGHMGCNGTVTFRFDQPFYLWLHDQVD